MMKPYLAIILGLLLAFQGSLLSAQEDKGILKPNETLSFEMPSGGSHQFTLPLKKNQFALLKLNQRGIDLMITTLGPDGEKLDDFDSPNGNNGPEFITLVSGKAGDYTLEVKPLDESHEKGNYDLMIMKIEAKAVTKGGQVDQMFAPWDLPDSPGAAVSVVQEGKIVHKNGYGMANLEYDIPITPATIFHIASVSKQFTAFSILLLEEEGKLKLDDDIRQYIPEVPDFGKTITLRHLATHTSGMRDQWNLLALAGWRLDDVITREHILKLVSHQKELNFDPGEEYLYCNTGFTLLAEVVARVSGQSFARFTDERIFQPLGMHHTLFYDDHEKIVKNRAYSYYPDSSGFKKSVLSYANVGATSLFTTVEDLSLWALNFEDPVVGTAAMIGQMKTRAVLNNGDTINYGLGQSLYLYKGLKAAGHGGADAGYRTDITRFPDQDFAVIVFSNLATFNPSALSLKITDLYLGDALTARAPLEEEPGEKLTGITVDEDSLKAFVGAYELQPGFNIMITLEDGVLTGQATGQPNVRLEALSTFEFEVVGVDATISFQRDASNRVNSLTLQQGGQALKAPRLAPFDPGSVDLSEFAGEFYSDELSTFYRFIVENDNLVARHQRNSDITLSPVKKDVFSGDAWFFGQAEFVRDGAGAIAGCKVSSGRVRNVYFQKTEQ